MLSFSPGKVYLVGSTVEIPPGNIRGIEGNNALIALQGSLPAINYAGEFDSSSGPSSGNNRELITQEFVSYVRNLHVYGSGDLYRGTGIALDGTLGTIVSGCHCFQLHTGIQVTGRQRNLVFLGNHLFDNEVAGIAFRGTNLHQVNLVGNHVMWSMAPIEATGSKLFNVQLTGNDIEVGGGTETAIRVRGGTFTEVQVAGNTIQGHGCKRILDVEPDTFKYVVIANNHLSNCDGDAVRLVGPTRGIKRVTVSDNTFKNVGGHAIAIGGREVTGVSVTCNNVEWGNCARVSSSGPVRHVQIANNVAAPSEKSGDAIAVVSEDGVSSAVLTGNVVRSSQSDPGETGYLCRVEAGGDLEFTTVTDNQLRTDAEDGYNGLRVAGDGNDGVIVRNNVVGVIGQEATAFELPEESESRTITSPNVGIPGPR